jgi:hypothetical protein
MSNVATTPYSHQPIFSSLLWPSSLPPFQAVVVSGGIERHTITTAKQIYACSQRVWYCVAIALTRMRGELALSRICRGGSFLPAERDTLISSESNSIQILSGIWVAMDIYHALNVARNCRQWRPPLRKCHQTDGPQGMSFGRLSKRAFVRQAGELRGWAHEVRFFLALDRCEMRNRLGR